MISASGRRPARPGLRPGRASRPARPKRRSPLRRRPTGSHFAATKRIPVTAPPASEARCSMGGAIFSGRIIWLRSIDPSSGTIGVSVGPPGTTTLTVMPEPFSSPARLVLQASRAGLGRAVGREAGIEHGEEAGGDVDDPPELLGAHAGHGGVGHVERPGEIDRHEAGPQVRRDILDLHDAAHVVFAHRGHPDRGIVDQHIEAPEMADRAVDAVATRSRVRHVHGQGDRPVGAELAMETKQAAPSDVSHRATRRPAPTKARARAWPMPPAAPVMRAMRSLRSGADMSSVPTVSGRCESSSAHLHDFARARGARAPDTVEIRPLRGQRRRNPEWHRPLQRLRTRKGRGEREVGPAPATPCALRLDTASRCWEDVRYRTT